METLACDVEAVCCFPRAVRDEDTKQKKMLKTEKEVEFVVIIEYVGCAIKFLTFSGF